MRLKLLDVATLVAGELVGPKDLVISGVGSLEDAKKGEIVFIESAKFLKKAEESPASAIIVPQEVKEASKPIIRTPRPRLAFAKVLEVFAPPKEQPKGIDPTSRIGKKVKIGKEVSVGAYVYLGDRVTLGDKVILYPFVYVGAQVKIGAETVIYPNVTIYDRVTIGKRVIIHSGTVVGSDGFGYERENEKYHKIPQIGTVIIEDDVEIGANVTIDRATVGATKIGRGTKIDNLVQVAHNVKIGENTVIAAQTGISGSVLVGERVIMAGQVGIADHLKIGSDVRIGAQAGVIGDVPPGSFISGYPARPHREQMRLQATLRKLPELIEQVETLRKKVEELEKKQEKLKGGKKGK